MSSYSYLTVSCVLMLLSSCQGYVQIRNNIGSSIHTFSNNHAKLTRKNRRTQINTGKEFSSLNEDSPISQQDKKKQQPLYVDLTPQERILKEALGIEPETPLEKQKRQLETQRKLNDIKEEKRKSVAVAVIAFVAACLNYYYQYTHPITSLKLLTDMQRKSDDITLIGQNGKPTVVDFWAPWCENCKSAAPTLSMIEDEYRGRVNFVLVNGDLGENWPLIERFGVDAIPHLAMVGSDGFVETSLIGPIPFTVLRADLDVMIENSKRQSFGSKVDFVIENTEVPGKLQLPYTMYDAFQNKPDLRKISF